jgi:GT2 family glycosyltransferase
MASAAHRVHPDLTVVVPTVGRPVLSDCLAALAAGASWPARVIVVDQSASPAVGERVAWLRGRGLDAVHLPSRQTGAAAARNRGLERAATALVAAVDDDCCVAVDWVDRMVERLRAHAGVVVSGRVDPEGHQQLPSTITVATPAVHTRPLWDRDPLFTGNMGTELATFRRVGPFDESPSLAGAEDNDWGYRALRLGVPIVYAPEVAVTHLDWRDSDELATIYRRYARAQGGFYGKHLRRSDPFIASRAMRDLLRGPWLVLRAGVTRNADLAVIGRAELRGILPGIVAGLRSGRRP